MTKKTLERPSPARRSPFKRFFVHLPFGGALPTIFSVISRSEEPFPPFFRSSPARRNPSKRFLGHLPLGVSERQRPRARNRSERPSKKDTRNRNRSARKLRTGSGSLCAALFGDVFDLVWHLPRYPKANEQPGNGTNEDEIQLKLSSSNNLGASCLVRSHFNENTPCCVERFVG